MKRIAFIGTSLSSALAAQTMIDDGASVVFFEGGSYGGAWGEAPIARRKAPRFNNVVFPYDKKQEASLPNLYEKLVGMGAYVDLVSQEFQSVSEYKPDQIIAGNFFPAIKTVLRNKSASVHRVRARELRVHASSVQVNGEFFDYAVLPLNAKVTVFGLAGPNAEPQKLSWDENRSEHVRILWSSQQVGKTYCEGQDDVFDRFGFLPGPTPVFIGRVRRELKGNTAVRLAKASSITHDRLPEARKLDIQRFRQRRLTTSSRHQLQEQTLGTRLLILNSSDLLSSMDGFRDWL